VIVSASKLALFALAAGALIIVPGPAVLFIVARSAHQGRRAGLVSAVGIAAGGAVHVAGAVLGFSALLVSSSAAFAAVRWLGAGYLVYLGVRTLRGGAGEVVAAAPPPASHRRLLAQGFVVNVLNPKTALFFLAFLPQFADPARGRVPLQLLVLGCTFLALAMVSDATYALLAGSLSGRLGRTPASRRRARLLTGGVYLALGLGTALAGSRGDASARPG
jgi:threonine/homoserine/homoserine lactone efflux protein